MQPMASSKGSRKLADIKLKHYVIRKGKYGYWLSTPAMKKLGFQNVRCGLDGPEAWKIAREWEERYQRARRGLEAAPIGKFYPPGSVGDGFARFRRTQEWAKKEIRTREDWERSWVYIEPAFGTAAPSTVTFELLDRWYNHLIAKKGVGEAGRALKYWRALYTVLVSLKLAPPGDPSKAIRKTGVAGRTQTWREGEVVRLVKHAIRTGRTGLACIIAVAWDTQFSPVDCRQLTPAQAVTSGNDMAFLIARGKTEEPALGILSPRAQRLVHAYLNSQNFVLHDDAPIFRTKGFAPGDKGGRPRLPVPYTKDKLVSDFAEVRLELFGEEETRRLMDMRRTGAVEANAGGASVEFLAAKMGNSIDQNRKLQKTYMPVNAAAIRAADEARKKGRKLLSEEHNEFKKLKLDTTKS